MNSEKLSIIIPCFNEESVIEETYKQVCQVINENDLNPYEIIFINDGSSDGTIDILRRISEIDKSVKVVSFSRNFGHQVAVSAGLKFCTGDIAVVIDADLQDPPEVIPQMIDVYHQQRCNGVYGVRTDRSGESVFKKATASLFYRLLNRMSEVPFPADTGDFRLIDRKIIDRFNSLNERNKYIRGSISWLGFKQLPIHYSRAPRFAGTTKYPLRKMINFAMTGIFYFSKKPLKLSIGLGVISILIGLVLAVYTLNSYLTGSVVKGWTSMTMIIIFFGGVQLFVLGIIGEYIGNIFDEVKKRPEFIVDQKINFD